MDTFPKLLLHQSKNLSSQPAYREKDLGIWQTKTWSQVEEEVSKFASGLSVLGFKRGMNLAVVGDNKPKLYWAMLAAQSLGGIAIPLYQDAPSSDMSFVLEDAEIDFAIAEDQEQVDKLLEIRNNIGGIRFIIYEDERGLRNYLNIGLSSFEQVQDLGLKLNNENQSFFYSEIKKGSSDDIAVILYTSGTTGKPKGVCHSYRSIIKTCYSLIEFDSLTSKDEIICYLPLAWIGDFLYSFALSHVSGFCLNCPESEKTVPNDLKEIGPTFYFAPPRIYENILTQVMIRIEDSGKVKKYLFNYFMDVAKKIGTKILEKKKNISIMNFIKYKIGEFLIYGPLKNVLGLSRVKVAYTGGEAIGPDLFNFFRSIGINLKILYGMTETCVTVCMQKSGDVKHDTVGIPMKNVNVKIADDQEILVKTPGLMIEYFKNSKQTKEVFNNEGYFKTGDAGYFDDDGHLKIIDRAKDVGKMLDGTIFAPKYLENKLKFFSFIKEAVVFGNNKSLCVAFINIDIEAVGNWAEKRNIPYSSYTDLSSQKKVYELIQNCIEKVNLDLSKDRFLKNSQILKFLVLHKELDPDDEELTRTRKLRRNFISDKYDLLVKALYENKKTQYIETQVKFEDGRDGIISANLKIQDVKTF